MFSSLPNDESLDKIKPKRIKLDDSIHLDPIKVNELKESVCIFDDIDVISDKKYERRPAGGVANPGGAGVVPAVVARGQTVVAAVE